MKNINKGGEPTALGEWRRTPGVRYEDIGTAEIRAALFEEQGHICCYCMSGVSLDNCRIEHWRPRKSFPERQLDYSNMLLACQGGGDKGSVRHCDRSKGDQALKYNPAEPRHNVESLIRYQRDGTIFCRDDAEFQGQLEKVLNLNNPFLKKNRAAVRRAVVFELSKTKGGISKTRLRRMVDFWNGKDSHGAFQPYCGVAVQYLRKMLHQQP